MSKQKTLKGSFSLCGKGLHTGLSLTVTFNPAPENTGYKIQRIDLEDQPIIQAVAENVVETQRGTVLGKGDVRVSTIEHGMSALYALGIDNCLIQVNGPEFPILDGSAALYVEKIQSVGIQEQNAEKDYYIIRHKIEVKDESGSVITIPLDEIAYAVQTRNEDSISIECCYKADNGQFTQETYDSLIRLLSWLIDAYELEPEDILRHYDCGGKKCPIYYTEHEDAWEQLKEDVKNL